MPYAFKKEMETFQKEVVTEQRVFTRHLKQTWKPPIVMSSINEWAEVNMEQINKHEAN